MGGLLMALPNRFRLVPVGVDAAFMLVGMLQSWRWPFRAGRGAG
jgi:hypothetical protein